MDELRRKAGPFGVSGFRRVLARLLGLVLMAVGLILGAWAVAALVELMSGGSPGKMIALPLLLIPAFILVRWGLAAWRYDSPVHERHVA